MTIARITVVLALAIVALASNAGAKPQSGYDQLEEIQTEDSNTPGGRENFPLNASASFSDTTSSPRKRATRAVPSRYVQTPGIGRYMIHTHARTWHEARKVCQEEGGDLAVINSEAESLNLAELMSNSYPHYESYESEVMLVGFNDVKQEGKYVTVDGRTLTEAGFAKWVPGEPNDAGNEDCGSIRKNGLLNDVTCHKKFAFACELPLVDEVGPPGPVGPQGITGEKGNVGIQGPAGRIGQKGESGAEGAPGAAGENGSKGDTGAPGSDGLKGEKGDLGVTGPSGPVGPVGPPGSDGAEGLKGDQGEPGSPGPAGLRGEKGDAGAAGVPGYPGHNGLPGHNGSDGEDGSAGTPGLDGSKGEPGDKGEKGDVGLKGDVGPSGTTGPIGLTGPPGPPGRPGFVNDTMCLAILSSMKQHPDSGLIYAEEAMWAFFPHSARDGLKEAPAKTCKDLFRAYPNKPNGEYWIDPNGDDVSDAILVYCDGEKRETCITPQSSRSPNISYTGDEREVWLSEIEDGMKIAYTADPSQIFALQALSSNAEQKVTYHCIKSVGYFDTRHQTNERGIKLLAWNDVEIEPRGSRQFRYDVISDGCRDRMDEWKETVVVYQTDRPTRLPVMDVGLRDVGKPDQQFFVDIGDVCFK